MFACPELSPQGSLPLQEGSIFPSQELNTSGVVCIQNDRTCQATIKGLDFDHIFHENPGLSINSGDYIACRLLIIIFWHQVLCSEQPSGLKFWGIRDMSSAPGDKLLSPFCESSSTSASRDTISQACPENNVTQRLQCSHLHRF